MVMDRRITLHIPGPVTVNDYGGKVPGPATDIPVWAERQDVTAAEQLDLDNDQRLVVQLSRFRIRARSDVRVDQQFTDDKGQVRRIIGMAELGRNRRLELMTEAIT